MRWIPRMMTLLSVSLLAFYIYGTATIRPAPVWKPPVIVAEWICLPPIGGAVYCFEW